MRVLLWGTYDLGKPRVRLMRDALRMIDPHLREIHRPVWDDIEDKSGLTGFARLAGIAWRWLMAYPPLVWHVARQRDIDVLVIGYLGLVDARVLAPIARMRGIPVVWDAFLSIYDTYAIDRRMASPGCLLARTLRWLERQACRAADVVVLDTMAHARLFEQLHGVPENRLAAAFVGAEDAAFALRTGRGGGASERPLVLFYGQFIPLHGIDTIVEAALSARGRSSDWQIIGTGQEARRIDAMLAEAGAQHVERIDWIDYARLQEAMDRADVCLGIFGTSEKAASVIPNKVFQALAAGMPLVTRDSPAMRELVGGNEPGLYLVRAGDSASLLDGLEKFARERQSLPAVLHRQLAERFSPDALAGQWQAIIEKALAR